MGPYFLAIDCGTQSLRVVIADLSGKIVAAATRPTPINFPNVSWAEQNAEDWWNAAKACVPQALAEAGLTPADIAGLSLDGTSCTVVACKRDGRVLRPVLLWMDQRAHEQAQRVTDTRDPVLKYVGWQESPEWMLPKALWLRENEPATYEQADLIVEGVDWLMYRLTGDWLVSLNNVTAKWNYANPEGGWPDRLLATLNLSELRDKWPTEVLPMGAPAGELSATAAAELGLKPGIPIAQGGIDAYAGMFGVGVVRPNTMALVIGTSTCHEALSAEGLFDSHVWGPYPDALLPGTWVLEGAQAATGAIVTWLADNFGYREQVEAEKRGADRFTVLDEKAAAVPPGAEGLTLLDYWQGNRSPIRDPLARGVIWGLSLKHEIGHLLRAVYEGTALGSRHIIEDLKAAGFEPEAVYACGGGTRSALWLQIHADASGIPIYLTEEPEATALGTAILAASGAGYFDNPAQAAEAMVKVTREVLPDPRLKDHYDAQFEKYVATYPALKDLMHG
ncbi:MAG: FGGY-family carbohydrate kinase [Armatimonadia bacterium]